MTSRASPFKRCNLVPQIALCKLPGVNTDEPGIQFFTVLARVVPISIDELVEMITLVRSCRVEYESLATAGIKIVWNRV